MPLRVWTYIGLAFAALSFIYGAFIVTRTLLFGNPVHGYASLISVMLFVGGIQLIGIGVIGEYLGRIYHESKQRPVYLVRRRYRADALVVSTRRGTPRSPTPRSCCRFRSGASPRPGDGSRPSRARRSRAICRSSSAAWIFPPHRSKTTNALSASG